MIIQWISSFGISISFFVLVLIIRKAQKTRSNFILMAWIIAIAFHLIYIRLSVLQQLDDNPLLSAIGNTLPLVHIMLISLYVQELYKGLKLKSWVYAIVFIAYVLTFYLLNYLELTQQNGLVILFTSKSPQWTYFITASFLLVFGIITFEVLRNIRSYHFNLKFLYSNELQTNVDWLNFLLTSYLMASVLIIVGVLLSDIGLFKIEMAFVIVCGILSLQVFTIGQLGVSRNFTFPSAKVLKYKASGLKEGAKGQLKVKLIQIFEEEKLYLNPDLNLLELAKRLDVPTYQASQLINESMNTSFFDFVNGYRVHAFIEMLKDPAYSHYTMLAMAFESGFNSKSGFYKAFKKVTGRSPSEYKKSLK